MATLNITASIPFGSSARIGYRIKNSANPFTYHNVYPNYSQFPYDITGLPVGAYEVEITVICPNCSGSIYSDPVVVDAVTL